MKRTLTILFAAVASTALAQTPTVVEKPAAAQAEAYLSAGYLWNAGIFVFRPSRFLAEARRVARGLVEQVIVDDTMLTIKLRLIVASVDTARRMGICWWETDPMLTGSDGHEGGRSIRGPTRRLERPVSLQMLKPPDNRLHRFEPCAARSMSSSSIALAAWASTLSAERSRHDAGD